MLPPLDIDGHLTTSAPISVQQRAVPVRPQVGRGARGVVADPDDLLVRGDGEGYPGPVYVVAPEEVVRDNRSRGMNDGYYAFQGEPFIALDV
jgi:hypothetical protein